MRILLPLALLAAGCHSPAAGSDEPQPQLVEMACGQCQFGLPGESCDLAVRIDGVVYFVDGTGIDDHGDAHADDGFCNAVRQAYVTGELLDGRFRVRSQVQVHQPPNK